MPMKSTKIEQILMIPQFFTICICVDDAYGMEFS